MVVRCSTLNGQKRGLLYQTICSGKKFGTILLMRWKKGSGKLYYSKPRLVYLLCNALKNAEHQHTTTVQTYNIATGAVCTDSA